MTSMQTVKGVTKTAFHCFCFKYYFHFIKKNFCSHNFSNPDLYSDRLQRLNQGTRRNVLMRKKSDLRKSPESLTLRVLLPDYLFWPLTTPSPLKPLYKYYITVILQEVSVKLSVNILELTGILQNIIRCYHFNI
jgi:hypothetical protein